MSVNNIKGIVFKRINSKRVKDNKNYKDVNKDYENNWNKEKLTSLYKDETEYFKPKLNPLLLRRNSSKLLKVKTYLTEEEIEEIEKEEENKEIQKDNTTPKNTNIDEITHEEEIVTIDTEVSSPEISTSQKSNGTITRKAKFIMRNR